MYRYLEKFQIFLKIYGENGRSLSRSREIFDKLEPEPHLNEPVF
jgi:hypothetical protein